MVAINLKLLCNNPDQESFYKYDSVFSKRDIEIQQRDYEMNCLKQFVFQLNLDLIYWNDFYYSYFIPQIRKEFDLLRLCENFVLNIELKSDDVPLDDIKKQLLRNKYYLMPLNKEIFLYTAIVKNSGISSIYKLNNNEEIITVEINELQSIIKNNLAIYNEDLDKYFKPSDFLVSPINNPLKFINNSYFLTPHQEEIKKEIEKQIISRNHSHPIITGKAGSGKTLLLYDMAKNVANSGKLAVIIHVGLKDNGHYNLERLIPNFKIIAIKQWAEIKDLDFETIFIDESQRLYGYQLKEINKICKEKNKTCVFCLDPEQLLNRAEVQAGVAKFLSRQSGNYKLTNKIRTNKELASFIKALFNLPKENSNIQYKNIHLEFCKSIEETQKILSYYREQGYEYIAHTPSSRVSHAILDKFAIERTSHRVIGQEFEKVVVLINSDFYYTLNGELTGEIHPCPDYMYRGLLFQEVTRAREELCIIVLKNVEIYKIILSILNREIFKFSNENCEEVSSEINVDDTGFDD